MKITFTRGSDRTYTTVAVRDDGVSLAVPNSDRMAPLPHDIGHYFVERELGLQWGFWGCVAAGALFPGIRVISGRQPPHAAERSRALIREAGQRGTEAEVWVGVLLGIVHDELDESGPVARERLAKLWTPPRPSRGPLSVEEARSVCAALRDVCEEWRALPVGGSIAVVWPKRLMPRVAGPSARKRRTFSHR